MERRVRQNTEHVTRYCHVTICDTNKVNERIQWWHAWDKNWSRDKLGTRHACIETELLILLLFVFLMRNILYLFVTFLNMFFMRNRLMFLRMWFLMFGLIFNLFTTILLFVVFMLFVLCLVILSLIRMFLKSFPYNRTWSCKCSLTWYSPCSACCSWYSCSWYSCWGWSSCWWWS